MIVEKISTDFIHFKKRFPVRDAVLTELFDFALVDCFQKIYEDKPSKVEIEQMLDQLLGTSEKTSITADPRIFKAMKIIQREPDSPISQEELAATVGLSASRFRHLFREHSDIPYRRYRMWRRTLAAMSSLHKVDNLTYAAMEGGFTDSAHFNHCFQGIFGVRPSLVFKNLDRFEVSARTGS
ncbi:helix-turn-helix domain-containing protein [Methyloprofundus sp.]|uniref:helix-turn-helix domain-containing protein n=1 Tax=Methyloprofundus sp. TaxID=2020875 RepID=UPI003D0E6E8B